MSKILIAIVMLGMSVSTLAAQDSKTKPVTPSSPVAAEVHQLQDEDQKLAQDEQQLMAAAHQLQSDLHRQHQRNREQQELIQKENKQWLHDTEYAH